ncbi:MAG: DNA methylase [Desulfamplus sp.]|nr:DNA methylase [Desulfamplus sp.]
MNAYFGSKATSGLCQPIIAMMPPHEAYIETHLGGGAIMKRKPPALINIGIDIDPRPISNFTCGYNVELVNDCALKFLQRYNFTGSELIYSDPPYLKDTRTSKRNYRFDYKEQDHIQLLELLKGLPCNVILSGYASSLYDNLLKDWRTIELQVMNQGGVRTEKIWYNFEVDRVHWVRFAGKNFTHRQCIKRKAANWKKRYYAMPKAERLAVLAAIMEVESQSD